MENANESLTAEQVQSPVSGGDCHLHTHNYDRAITHDQVLQFQDNEAVKTTSASKVLTYADDFIFVDASATPIALELPIARGGKTYTVVKLGGANSVTLVPEATDTINGLPSLVVSTAYSPVRLKALKGVGWVQI